MATWCDEAGTEGFQEARQGTRERVGIRGGFLEEVTPQPVLEASVGVSWVIEKEQTLLRT